MRLTEKLLSENLPFTAIIATNDLMAYGVIDKLKEKGYRVPDDVSVVGIDDIMYSKYISPPLTTLGYDYKTLGKKIFNALHAEICGEKLSDNGVETYIVERNTVSRR